MSSDENRTTTKHREHSQWKNTALFDTDGPPVHPTASTMLRGSGFEEGTRPLNDKLERCSQEGSTKYGTHTGRGRGSSPQRTRMTSDCGPMRTFMDASWITVYTTTHNYMHVLCTLSIYVWVCTCC